ncbi:MAG: winged helix-turn-helix domain-containing tetratricopeptide repeat protein, partial [bacterium]
MAIYQFGRCLIDSDKHELQVSGINRHIEPQVFDLILHLVEQGGEVVSQDALIENVWRGRVVSDSAISVRINAARKAVGDDGNKQEIIRTVPRRGFRLVADITRVDSPKVLELESPDQAENNGFIKPVVGVFPFESHSEDLPDYLIRGIAEDIATELSRFPEIVVIAPYSTFRHDFRGKDYFEVARSLGITHIVCGSLAGNSSVERVSVNLLGAEHGETLWSERYDIDADEYFLVQDALVCKVVATLSQGLKIHLVNAARSKPPANLSAYEAMLRGLFIYKWGIGTLKEAEQARFWFDRAIELDPDYGRPRAWRECVGWYWWSTPPKYDELLTGLNNITKAMALDESDHEVHRLKGAFHMCLRDHELGAYHMAKAVEVNPNDAHVLIASGVYRSYLADNTEDLTYVDLAFDRNPFHPAWYWQHRAVVLFAHGRYEEAISNLQRITDENEVACLYLAAAYAQLNQLKEAKEQIQKLHQMNPQADIDWLEVAYPTRCYQESQHQSKFVEGLRRAGLR